MKIKIGQDWGNDIDRDLARVNRLRELAGDDVELMVDANGAYSSAQARRVGAALDHLGVTWFEEPVSSDDTDGLAIAAPRRALRRRRRRVRRRTATTPAGWPRWWTACNSTPPAAADTAAGWPPRSIAAAHNLDVSAHCAPALHTPVAAAIPHLRHIEYFIDHTRLEAQLFDGIPSPANGHLHPDLSQPGHGITLSPRAERYRHRPD